ncbi:MAG TPA: hypothetical protein DCX60_00970 [Phycisphaerales bacterium]|nr:hypothetical protein [Phycisphaerales bacterium]
MMTSQPSIENPETMFEGEYALEMDGWFRRRYRNLCIGILCVLAVTWGIGALGLIMSVSLDDGAPSDLQLEGTPTRIVTFAAIGAILEFALVLTYFMRLRQGLQTREQLINASTRLLRTLSIFNALMTTAIYQGDTQMIGSVLWEIFFWHFLACLFLPWSAWESLKAMGPAYLLTLVLIVGLLFLESIGTGQTVPYTLLTMMGSMLFWGFLSVMFIPGMLICWSRLRKHGRRFKFSMLSRKYLDLRQDMAQARKIHDALFPENHEDEQVAFDFNYTPYSEIGGDFVWFERLGNRTIVILLDVTGHGLPAAMTINRIYGEIVRLRGEHPEGDPLTLMKGLERYFALTMAPHQIFATGITCELDLENGRLKWVNAGHPPGFVLSSQRDTVELETTAMMLGAGLPGEFDFEQREVHLSTGDLIGLYTDGVTEARSPKGPLFGMARLREVVENQSEISDWPDWLSATAQEFSRGIINDDILVASIHYKARPSAEEVETS